MANEEKVVSSDEILDDDLEENLDQNDATDWQAEARKRDGIAKRFKTQNAKLKADLEEERKKSSALVKNDSTTKSFDYAEKAYLTAKGIDEEEYDFVREVMQHTGKQLDEVLKSKYFKAELGEQREAKAAKDAIPSGSKRSSGSAKGEVDYWVNKVDGDGRPVMPPRDQTELRQKVVEARLTAERNRSHFTDNPVV